VILFSAGVLREISLRNLRAFSKSDIQEQEGGVCAVSRLRCKGEALTN
jgi:hypothetical protein